MQASQDMMSADAQAAPVSDFALGTAISTTNSVHRKPMLPRSAGNSVAHDDEATTRQVSGRPCGSISIEMRHQRLSVARRRSAAHALRYVRIAQDARAIHCSKAIVGSSGVITNSFLCSICFRSIPSPRTVTSGRQVPLSALVEQNAPMRSLSVSHLGPISRSLSNHNLAAGAALRLSRQGDQRQAGPQCPSHADHHLPGHARAFRIIKRLTFPDRTARLRFILSPVALCETVIQSRSFGDPSTGVSANPILMALT